MFFGGPNSGEAAVVVGNRLFGSSPPAENPFTGAGPTGKGPAVISYLLFVKEIKKKKKGGLFFTG